VVGLEHFQPPLPVSGMQFHHMLTQLLVSLEVRVIKHQKDEIESRKDGIGNSDVIENSPRSIVVACGRVRTGNNAATS